VRIEEIKSALVRNTDVMVLRQDKKDRSPQRVLAGNSKADSQRTKKLRRRMNICSWR
jgi:hypothetical protein